MKRVLGFLVALLLLTPAAIVLASSGAGEAGAAAGSQPKPVVFMAYMPWVGSDADIARIHKYIEDKTGVTFTTRYVKDPDDYGVQLTTAIAGQDDVDVFAINGKIDMMSYASKGGIQDLTEPINKYGPNMKKVFSKDVWKAVTVKGKIWAVPQAVALNTGVVLSIRKDWREKLGLPTITTVDQYENFLRKVKDADLDGNGKADTIPLLPYWSLDGLEQCMLVPFIGSAGVHKEWFQATYISPEGNVTPTVLHPKFKDYLARMALWYKDGLIYRDAITSNGNEYPDLIAANRVASVATWYSDFFTGWQNLITTTPNAVYEIIVLKGIDGSPAKFMMNEPGSASRVVTVWSKVAPYAIRIMDWFMGSKENYLVQVHGVQDVDWKWVNKDVNDIDKIKDPKLYAFSFIGYNFWNGAVVNKDWRPMAYRNATQFLAKQTALFWPDWFVAYDFTGTTIEKANVDAATLINEAIATFVLGRSTAADWDKAIASYKKMYADEFVKLATQQYKEYK